MKSIKTINLKSISFILILAITSSFASNTNDIKSGEAFYKAVSSKNFKLVKKMIEEDSANVNYVRRINAAFFIPVLMQAVMDNSTKIATYLIDNGADVNAKDGFKMTCLMWAANNGNIELIKTLLSKGADKNAADEHGMTALKAAEDKGFKDIVELLKN